jgi:hypothetical protein
MKRSEALKELMATLGAYDSWEEQCDYMLSRLLAIGMKPPARQVFRGDAVMGLEWTNEWESENTEDKVNEMWRPG